MFKSIVMAVVAVGGLLVGAPAHAADEAKDAKKERFFEMRTYVAAEGKFEALHARFRDHTNDLFRKHGMTIIGFWVPQDEKDGKQNTLVYMLAFPSRAARDASWAAFFADPEWKAAAAASEVNGKLLSKVESSIMTVTDFSPPLR